MRANCLSVHQKTRCACNGPNFVGTRKGSFSTIFISFLFRHLFIFLQLYFLFFQILCCVINGPPCIFDPSQKNWRNSRSIFKFSYTWNATVSVELPIYTQRLNRTDLLTFIFYHNLSCRLTGGYPKRTGFLCTVLPVIFLTLNFFGYSFHSKNFLRIQNFSVTFLTLEKFSTLKMFGKKFGVWKNFLNWKCYMWKKKFGTGEQLEKLQKKKLLEKII